DFFTSYFLLLQAWIVAVADQLGASTFGFLDVGKGPNLDVKEFVHGCVAGGKSWVLLLFEGFHERVGIFLLAHCGHLHIVAARGRRRSRIGLAGVIGRRGSSRIGSGRRNLRHVFLHGWLALR